MKYFFLLILTTSTYVIGQSHFIGLISGFDYTNVTDKEMFFNPEFKSGFTGGITYKYLFTDHLYLETGLSYLQKGYILENFQTDEYGNLIGKFKTTYNYNYLTAPVMIGWQNKGKLFVFGGIGLELSYLVSIDFKDFRIDDLYGKITKFNPSGVVEVGVGYIINDKFSTRLGLSGQKSFNNVTNSNYFEDARISHYGYSLSFVIYYLLN